MKLAGAALQSGIKIIFIQTDKNIPEMNILH